MKEIRPKKRLMFQLVLLLLLISLVPLFVAQRNLIKINENYLENDLLDFHTQRARQTAEEVSNYLKSTVEKLEIITRLQPLTQSFSDIQKYQLLFFFLEEYKDLISITMLDSKRQSHAEVIRPELSKLYMEEREKIRNHVFTQSLQGSVFVADPLPLPEKQTAIVTIGVPIFSETTVTGVLLADLSMEKIWEIVGKVSIRRHGEAYLVDRNGILIAHKDRDKVLQQQDMKDMEIVGNYLVQGKTGGALPFVNREGIEMLGAYAPLDLEGWGVVVQEPRKDAYSIVAEMKEQILVWGIVTGVIVCIIGLFFARKISVPIINFTRSALLIAKGNFKEKITVRTNNEIGQLAETFNYMVRQLDLYDKNMRRLFMSAISSLAAAIDERDPYTRGHSERVTEYSLAMADEMALNPKEREVVHIAGLLHDIGKIGIDDNILRKPSVLTKEEFRLIKKHPGKGANIMAPIKQLKKIIPSMRHHHERFDGEGYPDGISGASIPLPARIIAVADTFDAMTSDRPYQVAMDESKVVELIMSWADSRFDPAVCQAFIKAFQKNKILGMKRKEGKCIDWTIRLYNQILLKQIDRFPASQPIRYDIMKKKGTQKEKKSLFDWKMIRIPRAIIHFILIAFFAAALFVLLIVAVHRYGDRLPMLQRFAAVLGITIEQSDETNSMDKDVEEVHFAKLVFVKGDVTVKSKKELRFEKAEKDQILHEGDSIRTFSGGYAEVLFDEGNRLKIKPDSLVVIRAMKENRLTKIRTSSIKLRQSDVEATVRRPKVKGSEFLIETPTAVARISEAKVAVQVSKENDSQVKVYKGAVDLKVGEQSVEIATNKSVAVSKDKKIEDIKNLPPAPALASPENLAEFFFKDLNRMQAVLKWEPVSQDVKYRLQAAMDPYFSDLVIVRTSLAKEGVVVQGLKSGIYYWRISAVTSKGLEGDFSDYRVFKVTIDETPPEIVLDDVLLLKVSGKVNAQISGQTEPDATVKINGTSITPDTSGRFKYILSHVISDMDVSVVAEDRVGNQNILKKRIEIQ